MSGENESAGRPSDLDRRWHLARNAHETDVTELEFALMRVSEAFVRWQSECITAASGLVMSGGENALLHVIRLHERPKPLKELARLTNRDDIANLQYSLRKLIKFGLIEQHGARNSAVYSATERGRQVTDRYAALRAELLIEITRTISGGDERLSQATQMLNLFTGLYEQAARVVATHQRDC
jgi:predicted MarR family transcription regulator